MKVSETSLPGVLLIEPRVFSDPRGAFWETYQAKRYADAGIAATFVQDNGSRSVRGTLRGLHYQRMPWAQGKLVQVVRGEVFDVAVDMRRGSPSFGQWVGVSLSQDARRLMYVPVGFAHGFQVLSETADVIYKVTQEYAPRADRGIAWNDPTLAIDWPIADPLLSPKDKALPTLNEAENNFIYEGWTP